MYYTYHPSPIGPLLLAGDVSALQLIDFPTGSRKREPEPDWQADPGPFAAVIEQLDAYFARELTQFDLSLAPVGTAFQREVWAALQTIPYGATWSYGQLAKAIGRPKASRAVGAANGANPLSIVIPCHRVIGANGDLTGFGGGLPTKRWLLDLEGALPTADEHQLNLFPNRSKA